MAYKVSVGHCLVNHLLSVLRALEHPAKRAWTVTRPIDHIRIVHSRHGRVGALRLEAGASLRGHDSAHFGRAWLFTQLASQARGAHELLPVVGVDIKRLLYESRCMSECEISKMKLFVLRIWRRGFAREGVGSSLGGVYGSKERFCEY